MVESVVFHQYVGSTIEVVEFDLEKRQAHFVLIDASDVYMGT